jgi:hypothetical protein
MAQWFHVTSSSNRDSIKRHGLDWTHMNAARGIAGSTAPEQNGTFLCFSELEAGFFIDMNNTGGPVDLWAVEGIDRSDLVESPEGFLFLPRPIPPSQLTLVRADIEPPDQPDEEFLDGTGGWSGYAPNPEPRPE